MRRVPISLDQLKELQLRAVTRWKQQKDRSVQLRTADGQEFIVQHATAIRRGVHLIVSSGGSSVILRSRSAIFEAARLAAVIAALVVTFAGLVVVTFPSSSEVTERYLKDLSGIQKSLADLDEYVSNQRSVLERLSGDIEGLRREKSSLARAVQMDRAEVHALLAVRAAEERRQQWWMILLSFAVGVLSSVAAHLIIRIGSRRA